MRQEGACNIPYIINNGVIRCMPLTMLEKPDNIGNGDEIGSIID